METDPLETLMDPYMMQFWVINFLIYSKIKFICNIFFFLKLEASNGNEFLEWKIILFPGIYNNSDQTKRNNTNIFLDSSFNKNYIISFWNDEISINCMQVGYFIYFNSTGKLTIDGNGGKIMNCTNSAITTISSLNVFGVIFSQNTNKFGRGGVIDMRRLMNETSVQLDSQLNLVINKCFFIQNFVQKENTTKREIVRAIMGGGALVTK